MNLLMVELVNEVMDLGDSSIEINLLEQPINPPIYIDELYNLIVCKDCGIGIPLDWILSHLKDSHGIIMTMEQIRMFLSMENRCMTMSEAKDWMSNVWIMKPVQNIPIIPGYICNECQYSAEDLRVMRNHFSKKHKGIKASKYMKECKVQMVFKGPLHKYVQIEENDEMEMELEGNSEWKMALKLEFEGRKIGNNDSISIEHEDVRLMGAFIAKTRWDLCVKGMNMQELVQLAAAPKIKDKLREIIVCGKRYIDQCCEALNGGNIMIKRLIMTHGYIIII